MGTQVLKVVAQPSNTVEARSVILRYSLSFLKLTVSATAARLALAASQPHRVGFRSGSGTSAHDRFRPERFPLQHNDSEWPKMFAV
jgi:hypothetical protein